MHQPVSHQQTTLHRPIGVSIISLLVFVQGLLLVTLNTAALVLGVTDLSLVLPPWLFLQINPIKSDDLLLLSAQLVLGGFALLSGVGMLQLRRWAWLMAMIVQGITLAIALIEYIAREPSYLNMLLGVVIVLYLNQRPIQHAFNVALRQSDPGSIAVTEADRSAAAETQAALSERR